MNLKKLNTNLIIGIMLISTLTAMTLTTGAAEVDLVTVRGYLYIDDDGTVTSAPEGIMVTLSFDSGDETDTTNENGYYQFDFLSNSYIGETGHYTVSYQGEDYIALDQYDNTASIDIETDYIYLLDIFIILGTSGSGGGSGSGSGGGSGGGIGGGGSGGGSGGGGSSIDDLVVDAGGTYYGVVGEEISITGTATGGTSPYTFEWDLDNDGNFDDGTNENPTYTWSIAGQYTIKLKVTDSNSLIKNDEATVIISSLNNPPYALIIDGITEGTINTAYDFTSTCKDDDESDQVKYGWDWNNDDLVDEWTEFKTPDTTVTIKHTFSSAGFYIVKAQAEDNNNGNSGWSNKLLVFIDVDYYIGDNGKYYIDIDRDGTPDKVYDPETGTLDDVLPEDLDLGTDNKTSDDQNILWFILGIILLIIFLGLFLFFLKRRKKQDKKPVN